MSENFSRYYNAILRAWAKRTFSPRVRARFYRKLAALINNGVKMMTAIDTLYARSQKRGETETLTIILADVRLSLRRGDSLSNALMTWATPLESMTIAAGEESGNLGEMLILAADSLGGVKEMTTALYKGLAQPVFLFIAFIAAIYYIGTTFLPDMMVIADPTKFTGSAASLYWFSTFVQTPWFWIAIAGFIGVLIAIVYFLPHTFGEDKFRVYLDVIPPYSIYRLVIGSGFLAALAALLRAGVQLQDAIIQIRKYSSPYLSLRLNSVLFEIRKGRNFGEALDASQYEFPDREIIDDLITYSTLPNFDQVLYEYGKESMKDGIESVKEQVLILNGVAIFLMLLVIAWLASGMMQIEQQMGSMMQMN